MTNTNIYDNSQTSTYQTCPMKYYLKYDRGIKKRDGNYVNVDLDFGRVVHKFLENHYLRLTNKPVETNISIWDELPIVPGEKHKTREAGQFLANRYMEQYPDPEKVLAVEETITFDLDGFPYGVKVDTVVQLNGQIYGLEHKTSGNIGYGYFDRYFINSQISAQTFAIMRKYGECSGIILNAMSIRGIEKPALLSPGSTDCAYYSDVEVKYSKYYKKQMAYCSGYKVDFGRSIIQRTPQELGDWYQNQVKLIKKIEQDRNESGYVKHDGSGVCTMFRGCQFKELCKVSTGMDIDEQIEDVLYEKHDPFAYLKEGLREGA